MALQGRRNLFVAPTPQLLNKRNIAGIIYHNVFDYPLTVFEIEKWTIGPLALKEVKITGRNNRINKNFTKRILKEKISRQKLLIAKKAAKIIGKIPTVRLVAVTGALAMMNATDESDIDLMIITRVGTLWTTRFLTYLVLSVAGFPLRKPRDTAQKDKLCLNIWLDETSLAWNIKDRNIYTAHEIAQIIPLVNKFETYQKFLVENKWILGYWPNAVVIEDKISNKKGKEKIYGKVSTIGAFIEKFTFWFQFHYMKKKITREIIIPQRAIFHPNDWGALVLKKLSS